MTTKRKPVKKAAKKVVKKTITMKQLDGEIKYLHIRNDNRMSEIIELQQSVELIRKELNLQSDRTYSFKKYIWWTRFWLAITVIVFVAYAIITA